MQSSSTAALLAHIDEQFDKYLQEELKKKRKWAGL